MAGRWYYHHWIGSWENRLGKALSVCVTTRGSLVDFPMNQPSDTNNNLVSRFRKLRSNSTLNQVGKSHKSYNSYNHCWPSFTIFKHHQPLLTIMESWTISITVLLTTILTVISIISSTINSFTAGVLPGNWSSGGDGSMWTRSGAVVMLRAGNHWGSHAEFVMGHNLNSAKTPRKSGQHAFWF